MHVCLPVGMFASLSVSEFVCGGGCGGGGGDVGVGGGCAN